MEKHTREEVPAGWIVGPFTEHQVTDQLGEVRVPAWRSPVAQGDRLRFIDV